MWMNQGIHLKQSGNISGRKIVSLPRYPEGLVSTCAICFQLKPENPNGKKPQGKGKCTVENSSSASATTEMTMRVVPHIMQSWHVRNFILVRFDIGTGEWDVMEEDMTVVGGTSFLSSSPIPFSVKQIVFLLPFSHSLTAATLWRILAML
ncbi:unnamed protein product [Cuscuta campestris]|uniref:Uncharacterized protein n=1 Tax=Cuscuta campestris TaxID=132261 RepID=A0A484MNY0_9ASTE|nr:unnamed protein product [Cuscuta campestris]